jgi:hypothetical protein
MACFVEGEGSHHRVNERFDDFASEQKSTPFLKIAEPVKKMQLSGISLVFSETSVS